MIDDKLYTSLTVIRYLSYLIVVNRVKDPPLTAPLGYVMNLIIQKAWME